jgi:hypothetical protein
MLATSPAPWQARKRLGNNDSHLARLTVCRPAGPNRPHSMTRLLLVLAVLALYVLHQDVWFWRSARPLVFGFLPVGLAYHALFSIAASLVMWLLVRYAWPSQLESADEE